MDRTLKTMFAFASIAFAYSLDCIPTHAQEIGPGNRILKIQSEHFTDELGSHHPLVTELNAQIRTEEFAKTNPSGPWRVSNPKIMSTQDWVKMVNDLLGRINKLERENKHLKEQLRLNLPERETTKK